jgi:uncharacterized protein
MDKIVIVGAGVAGINAATKLVDNNYKGQITIIDMGKDPHNRLPEEVMTGMLGAGGWSDGKLTYHTEVGGQLAKYCGEEKAMELFDQVIANFKRFHPKPEEVQCSDPQAEPDFIKPHFGLKLFPVWHIGTDYLHEIAINWYKYLVDNGVEFIWEHKVYDIDFVKKEVSLANHDFAGEIKYDKLIFGVGKSGIDFGKKLAEKYELPTEPKAVQIGVRFEAPQKHFQKLIDISYDFKLYRKFEDKGVSLRSFCTNNNAAYVAAEHTYGDYSYNGPEPLVNYDNLSLTKYPNVYFVGDALSARGITVSGAQGTYVAESLLKNEEPFGDIIEF